MLSYLFAKNINIKDNWEELIVSSVFKYLILIAIIKVIEFKYLELGFFNTFVIIFVLCDIVMLSYHLVIEYGSDDAIWNDDLIDSNFSLSAYRDEINQLREQFKRIKTSKVIEVCL
jgi:hypothetical protein